LSPHPHNEENLAVARTTTCLQVTMAYSTLRATAVLFVGQVSASQIAFQGTLLDPAMYHEVKRVYHKADRHAPALAKAAEPHTHMTLNRAGAADPTWNGTSVQAEPIYKDDYPNDDNKVGQTPAVQAEPVYHKDYPKDENGNGGHGGHGGHGGDHDNGGHFYPSGIPSVPDFSPVAGHSAQWYREKCASIRKTCKQRKEAVDRAHASKVHHLEDEYTHDVKILDSKEERLEESQRVVRKQTTEVREVSEKIVEVRKTYERTKDCRAELRRLEDELEELESQPNDSDEAIDAECRKKKDILHKAECVEKHEEAETTWSRRKVTYTSETETLSENQAATSDAAQAVPPYEKRTDEAKGVLDEARRETGADHLYSTIDKECTRQVENLQALADKEASAAEAEYRRHKELWETRSKQHQKLEEEVTEQSHVVREEKRDVEEANRTYEVFKDCPAELERAEAHLRELEETPNESSEDIDAECHQKKVVLRKRLCTDKFYEAKDVLVRTESVYSSERHELKHDSRQEEHAETVAEGYEKALRRFEQAREDA